ncbi:hypothetical protein, partial [Klebsiella aerogenes]|uniref:hypothetical protein n=1 Tax=Klebsiella aerogenes TaxID=548 RepID=UPI001CC7B91C
WQNLLNASHLTPEQFEKASHKLVGPRDCGLPATKMVDAYLGSTPFVELLSTNVPFQLKNRFSHHHIVATPNAGKTNLLSGMIVSDLD